MIQVWLKNDAQRTPKGNQNVQNAIENNQNEASQRHQKCANKLSTHTKRPCSQKTVQGCQLEFGDPARNTFHSRFIPNVTNRGTKVDAENHHKSMSKQVPSKT